MILNLFIKQFFSHKVVLFKGNGIGPQISQAVVPIQWQQHQIHTKQQTQQGDLVSSSSIQAVQKHKFGLKGPFQTPIGKGFRSINLTLRKKLNLYANVRPCRSIEGIDTPYKNVNLGEYSGLEHQVIDGVVQSLKIISRNASQNIARYAFQYAKKNITACHKAGVMKLGDGLFIQICKQLANQYPQITYNQQQIDTICMKLASNPQLLDVMVMPNLYGDIVSDLCAGLIGGLGLTASGNIGKQCAVYQAVHGTAPDIAGKNLANPTAFLLSSTMMLRHMNLEDYAERIQKSIQIVLKDRKYLTRDLGGKSTTTEYCRAIIDIM